MSKRKLLLADDSVTVQKVVNLAFESEDIEVITADDGTSAFEKFVEFSPDLVMADINMPGADGYEICERIKQDEATKHIPVLLLVGSFEPFSEEKAARVGAAGFLKKPFQSIGLLISKVTELLEINDAKEESAETEFSKADTRPIPIYEPLDMSDSDDVYPMGETGMDDEMIETERVADYSLMDETSKYETNTEVYETSVEEDEGKTQPMTYADVEELNLTEQDEETSEQPIYELADEPDEHPPAETYDFGADQENEDQHIQATEEPEETFSNRSDSYDEYSDYQQAEEAEKAQTEFFPAPQAASALDLDELELLELPPLEKISETSATDYTAFNKMPETTAVRDDSDFKTAHQEKNLQPENDYSNYAETTAEESYSLPKPPESSETQESYYAPTQEPSAAFDSSESQPENVTDNYETPAENSAPEMQTKTDSEIETISAEATHQEIDKADDTELVMHYFPPEVIDAIAEKVVEKLAEKLRR